VGFLKYVNVAMSKKNNDHLLFLHLKSTVATYKPRQKEKSRDYEKKVLPKETSSSFKTRVQENDKV